MRQTLLFSLLVSIIFTSPAYATNHNQIALQLQWKHQFEFAGFYAAIAKGFYEEAGLDVQLFEYQDGIDQIQEVLSGRKQFGIWGDGLLRSYLQGKPLVLLANYFKRSPLILLTSPEIRAPIDLRGKKIMVSAMDAQSAGYLQMLRKFKVDPSEITVIPPSFDIQDFIDGKVDGYFAFSTNEPFLLQQQGVVHNVLDFNNYGSELYDVNLFTSKEYAHENPEIVRAFIEASNRGWDYALKHPDELIELILKEYNSQEKSREALLFEYQESLKFILQDSHPIGSVDPEKIRTMGNVLGQNDLAVPLTDYQDFIFDQWQVKSLSLTDEEQRFIEKHPVIILGAAHSSAPMIIDNKDGSLSGIDMEIAQLIKERTGLNLNFQLGTWNELLEEAENHDIDGLAASVAHVEREKYFNFSTPYFSTNMAVIVKAGNPFQIKSVADLKGKRIAIPKDNLQMEKLVKSLGGSEIVHCSNAKKLLGAVISEQADCMIWHEGIMHMASVSGLSYVEVVFPVGDKVDVRYSLRKDWPELTTIINKALHSISIQEISSIREKWSGLSNVQAKQVQFSEAEQAYLKEKGSIKMCVDPDWMPFERITENGIHEGMAADLLAMMQQRSGVSLELLPTTSWSESIAMAKSRQCDIFSLAMATPERREYMDFTTPYLSFPFVIATRSDKVFIDRIERVLDKPLALVKGYAYTEILKKRYPDATFVEVDNLKAGFQLLRDGEVYGYIDALAPIAYTIQQEGMSEIKIAGKFDDPWELAIGTRKDEPLLLTVMQKMTDTLTKKEKRESYNTWFSIKIESATDYSLIWKILLGALALFIVFLYWNLKLHASKKATQQALEALGLARNQLEEKNRDLIQALEEVKQLSGILPICCQCKQVRNDKGYWQQVELYVSDHSEAKFSHGFCPTCYEKEMARIDTWEEKSDANSS